MAFFQDFPVLENGIIKFQDFPGFPGPVRTLHSSRENELNKLTSLPMCGFIAQLVEHLTGIAEVTGSNPVEALIFSGFFFPIASNGKYTAMIILNLNNFFIALFIVQIMNVNYAKFQKKFDSRTISRELP